MLVNPICPQSFLEEYWLKRPLYLGRVEGEHNSSLFSWTALNELLTIHQPLPPRLVLKHKGRQIAASQYIRQASGWQKTRIDVSSVESLLGAGATLIVNGVDELYTPLREALADLERTFMFPIHANLYAAWALDEAFPMHWDEQETFIVQIAGSKHWTIHSPTAVAPDRKMHPPPPMPSGSPEFDLEMKAGQSLYLPKGWWHRVTPMAESTLHLTITCETPTGINLLHWVADRMANVETARLTIPYERYEDHLRLLQQAVIDELSRPETIRAYWEHSAATTKALEQFRFPSLRGDL